MKWSRETVQRVGQSGYRWESKCYVSDNRRWACEGPSRIGRWQITHHPSHRRVIDDFPRLRDAKAFAERLELSVQDDVSNDPINDDLSKLHATVSEICIEKRTELNKYWRTH